MKFCYLDESGTGDEPHLVMAGVVVDASRMHLTKTDWTALLMELSARVRRPIVEFHAKAFYAGRSPWRDLDGSDRAAVVTGILKWLKDRKHKLMFAVVDKEALREGQEGSAEVRSLDDEWCAAAWHIVLQLQRLHQGEKRLKGHTVIVFDDSRHAGHFLDRLAEPMPWTESFYGRKRNAPPLNQLVDVPYFAASDRVHLIQIADLVAFILRRHAEVTSGADQRYEGERQQLEQWVGAILDCAVDRAVRWLTRKPSEADRVFMSLAPEPLLI